ncbi:hypothetical protein [Apilactobacillus micheneri]|uniref:Uncharacterized protein n=1 Tax=Apilactobacillus micheneri TaxID=1899430 RepID=A0A9Q8MTU9_9LACO|nr:hypothetical protein [Apilactobacillus micheneri]TPR39996.1 hypothetical protein DY121_03945 [Apilactobacillus micheneri]TPR41807.1 hypothetical protein DY123_04565 [Apilactobacillus micheneri]TPR44198.1 hypothetical protein DY130_03940 [Apilactobacillus micheneri]TPR45822.1 hypothetical protein DY128_03940 [Apilactobacillus micheneri]TPR50566.1 hypothetical protein DY037_01055 [Apilactobacillus micheneri]
MLKKILTAFAIVVMSLSFSYGSFNVISNSNNVYAASKHHKKNGDDLTFWQKIYAGFNVQD